MAGEGDNWGSWTAHPSLAEKWNLFEELTAQGPHNPEISKLCKMVFNPSASQEAIRKSEKDSDEEATEGKHLSLSIPVAEDGFLSPNSQLLTQISSQGFPYLSQPTEEHDIDSFLMELHEVLESHNIPLSDDLVSSLSDLPQQAYPQLLKRLQEELTAEGLQTLCELACEDIQESILKNNWLHPALICKFILLPKVMNESECPNELCIVLEVFARECPKIVIVQILQPILINDQIMALQNDLVKRVTSALPSEHHLHLIKYVLKDCVTPLPVPKINALITVLGATSADLTAVLSKLMNLLELSSDPLAENEQFSNLLLIIVRRLPPNVPESVNALLAHIVRRNKSFNKQTLLNALKEKL